MALALAGGGVEDDDTTVAIAIGHVQFDGMVIDFDVGPNWGNWQYVAGVGNDPRNRVFDVRAQASRYDEDGAYRACWGASSGA